MIKERVCIVGVGLMGGSLALALRLAQRLALRPSPIHLTLVDANRDTLTAAQHLADVVTADLAEGVRQADVVILATPARAILRLLAELPRLRPDGCLVLDLGSTKAAICRAMNDLPDNFQAMGGHPMCGKETAGFAAATPDLYRDKTFVLCHTERAGPEIEAFVKTLLDIIGARPFVLPAEAHDEIVAVVSHLPYLVAATLMRAAVAMGDARVWPVSASGFRDTSRVAGTDPRMMLDILLTNKTAVLAQLEQYRQELTAVTQLLQSADEAELANWLAEVQRRHVTYRQHKQRGAPTGKVSR